MNQKMPVAKPSMMNTAAIATDAPIGTTGAPPPVPAVAATAPATRETVARYVWAAARLSMGWVFLWPFLDKMFGLGHETPSAKAWINGGNPTEGFLSGSVGPFSGIYHDMAGAGWVNVMFMAGLAAIAVGLLLGIYMRLACAGGAVLVLLMWSASLPPENDVFMDDHIIYALLLTGLALVGAGNTLGLGRWWTQTPLVRRFAWLG